MYASGAMEVVQTEHEVDSSLSMVYHASTALTFAHQWDERAVRSGLYRFPQKGRYI
jgi:hypothetical protein